MLSLSEKQAELKSQVVNGLTLSWLSKSGEHDPLLLFLHGFPDTARVWEPIMQALPDYTQLAPFVHGVLGTEKIPAYRYGLQAWCLDLLSLLALDEHVNHREVILIAHDLGGPYARVLADYLGQRCRGLIFINSLSLPQLLTRMNNPKQWLKSYYILLFQLPGLPESLLKLFHPFTLQQIYDLGGVDKDDPLRQETRHVFTGIEQYRQILKQAPRALLSKPEKFRPPTLFIWGDKDPFLEIPTQTEVEPLYEHPTIRVLQGNHWILRSHSIQIARYIRQFIEAQARKEEP